MADVGSTRGGFAEPGARTTRQESIETEVKMPRKQAELRAGIDILAALLVIAALVVMGRWVIWLVIFMLLFSEWYDILVDAIVGRLNNPAALIVDLFTLGIKWIWPFAGYAILRIVVPITWTQHEMLWQRSVLEFAWPVVFHCAVPWSLPITAGMRIVLLIFLIAPLFTWRSLRDSLLWRIEEFTPYGPINAAEQGINPREWGPRPEKPAQQGKGIIIEKTDYQPHTERIAEGVFVSNGTGSSAVRIDMRWVTDAQWRIVARKLLDEGENFSEDILGRGLVFPTHGPFDQDYQANLGFRFFRDQMIEAEYAEYRGNHPNSGVVLTQAGEDFLRRRFLEDREAIYDDIE
jgi:hypothetical protein